MREIPSLDTIILIGYGESVKVGRIYLCYYDKLYIKYVFLPTLNLILKRHKGVLESPGLVIFYITKDKE